ncbi:MAG: hypothetical protein Q7R35_03745, partial [Elusimicrobiota bacterium]|nr:hypothetical protein [Elusimicrobiota bacterium]
CNRRTSFILRMSNLVLGMESPFRVDSIKHCYPAPLQQGSAAIPQNRGGRFDRNTGLLCFGTVVWFALEWWFALAWNTHNYFFHQNMPFGC